MTTPPNAYRFDSEMTTAIARLIAVLAFGAVIWSGAFQQQNTGLANLDLLKMLSVVTLGVAVIMVISVLVYPGSNPPRYLIGISLDALSVSGALYLGEGALAPAAALYLWTMVGSGFVFGVRYLYFATTVSLLGFAVVFWASAYWRESVAFSVTIATSIVLLTPYMATLLTSLRNAKNLISWQAKYDALTHALNRGSFKAQLGEVLVGSTADHQDLLLFCDLDRFKRINDTAGHAAGDKALQDVCKILAEHTGPLDLLGRMGGDEFCILLRNRSWETGRATAEKIRNAVASYRLAWGTGYYSLGISIGMAPASAVTDEDSLIRLADAACYAAKNAGRNQVHVVDPRVGPTDTQTIRHLSIPPQASSAP